MGFEKLNIGQGIDKIKEGLQGNTVDKFRAASSSETAGAVLMNAFDPDDPSNSSTAGTVQGGPAKVGAVQSDFNPFNVFRYKRFAKGDGGTNYDFKKHSDLNLYNGQIGGLNQEENNSKANLFSYIKNALVEPTVQKYNIGDFQKNVRNPTANQIIEASGNADLDSIGPAPYSANDFVFCKHYGKIPNNRLVTLRRFLQPVQDNLKIIKRGEGAADDTIAVPISQGLTYFGEGTDNELSKILPLGWDVKWEDLESDVRDIDGNEKLAGDLIASVGITDSDNQDTTTAAIALANGGDPQTTALQISGYEEELQKYVRNAYDKNNGPYWNRVLGPVNVINKSRKRARGMGETMFTGTMAVKFQYNLRSFNFKNPKVAMLDLISNFLTLTYNTAPFWGGGYRYFQNPGVKVSLDGQDEINEGKFVEGITKALKQIVNGADESVSDILKALGDEFRKVTGAEATKASENRDGEYKAKQDASGDLAGFGLKLGNILLAAKASNLLQKPLSYRSLLEGRPIGEWHMVIGNPLDPIAAVGDLICEKCTMTFGKKLGADDFPTEVTFDVTLKHGRPRAKQDIESIFNLGGGPLSFSKIAQPSSTSSTFYGTSGTNAIATGADSSIPANQQIDDPINQVEGSFGGSIGSQDSYLNETEVEIEGAPEIEGTTDMYAARVKSHYGERFGQSSLLNDYIKKVNV